MSILPITNNLSIIFKTNAWHAYHIHSPGGNLGKFVDKTPTRSMTIEQWISMYLTVSWLHHALFIHGGEAYLICTCFYIINPGLKSLNSFEIQLIWDTTNVLALLVSIPEAHNLIY